MFKVRCLEPGCYWNTHHETESDYKQAKEIHDKRCPVSGVNNIFTHERDERGMAYTKPHVGKSLAEQLWDKLDSITADLMDGTSVNTEYNKGMGRAYADAVFLMCKPYYKDSDAVVKQSVKRAKMKKGTVEWEPTPGYRYNPPPPGSRVEKKYLKHELPKPVVKARKKATSPAVTSETATAIKKGLASGLFTAQQLAQAYKLSEAEVNSISKQ